jgi:alpha-glucosidase
MIYIYAVHKSIYKIKSKLKIVAAICLLFCLNNANAQNKKEESLIIESPDKAVKFYLQSNNGSLIYFVNFNNRPIIKTSGLGLTIDGKIFGEQTSIGKIEKYMIDETYPYRGVHSVAKNKCNGAKISINAKNNFIIEARVFNDGAAFRYIINKSDSSHIEKDNTEFIIPPGSAIVNAVFPVAPAFINQIIFKA